MALISEAVILMPIYIICGHYDSFNLEYSYVPLMILDVNRLYAFIPHFNSPTEVPGDVYQPVCHGVDGSIRLYMFRIMSVWERFTLLVLIHLFNMSNNSSVCETSG
jgi:hypothetical protein